MAQRANHYESAFESLLQRDGVGYVAVNEAKKAELAGAKVKCFDFLVYGADGTIWLTDVKGRRFPYEHARGRRYWENWVTGQDLDSLQRWQEASGESSRAAFVFAYWLSGPGCAWPHSGLHWHRGRWYAFLAVRLADYRAYARRRSTRWDTYTLPTATFRRLAEPVQAWWRPVQKGRSGLLPVGPAYNEVGVASCGRLDGDVR